MAKKVLNFPQNVYESAVRRFPDIWKDVESNFEAEWQQWHDDLIAKGKGQKLNQLVSRVNDSEWMKKATKLSGSDRKVFNRLITGHDFSDKYLKMWKIKEKDECENCKTANDANHIILKCVKFEAERRKTQFMINYDSVIELIRNENEDNVKKLLDFVKDNGVIL